MSVISKIYCYSEVCCSGEMFGHWLLLHKIQRCAIQKLHSWTKNLLINMCGINIIGLNKYTTGSSFFNVESNNYNVHHFEI